MQLPKLKGGKVRWAGGQKRTTKRAIRGWADGKLETTGQTDGQKGMAVCNRGMGSEEKVGWAGG